MATAWYMVPYKEREWEPGYLDRYCAMNDLNDEIFPHGGRWAEAQIDGNQAIVRVRSTPAALDRIALAFRRLSDSEAQREWTPTRRTFRFIKAEDRIDLHPSRTKRNKPLAELIRQIPEQPPSREILEILGLWTAVGFGQGWRLPFDLCWQMAQQGIPPFLGGAFPVTTAVLDDFNRANQTLVTSANWDHGGIYTDNILDVISNQLGTDSGTAIGGAYWSAGTFGPDCETYITVPTLPGSDGALVMQLIRLANVGDGTTDGYEFQMRKESGVWIKRIRKWTDESQEQIGSDEGGTFVAGDKIGAEIIGSTLQMYRFNGSAWATFGGSESDSDHGGAGFPGLVENNATFRFDDYVVGTIAGAAPAAPTAPRLPRVVMHCSRRYV